ncbi:MAG: hypothetical protein JJU05_02295 [Verrucomicrobia bacterium]|nr:hypothetical protein [Verrucomicrobiota bacterium]MCH8528086.1 hypothetical protein [Kiritimatiellia bacterium]
MKPIYPLSLILAVLCVSDLYATGPVYEETFDTGAAGHTGIGSVLWQAHYGANASSASSAYQGHFDLGPILANIPGPDGKRGALFNRNFHNGVSWIYWTDVINFGPVAGIDRITFDLANATPDENIHVAIRINVGLKEKWFVSQQVFNNPRDLVWDSKMLKVATSTFLSLDFISGVTLGRPGRPTALPARGQVTAIGFYDQNKVSTLRLDNVTVIAQPAAAGQVSTRL